MVREGYISEMDGSTRARPVVPKAYEDLQESNEGALKVNINSNVVEILI